MSEILHAPNLMALPPRPTIQRIAAACDFTLLYSIHGTAEQADEVADSVPDGSIVFKEGYYSGREYAIQRLGSVLQFATSRLHKPSYDHDDQQAVQEHLSEFIERRLQPQLDPDYFGAQLFSRLFAKNCLLLPADYMNLPDGPELPELTATAPLFDQVTADNLEVIALELANNVGNQNKRVETREFSALAATLDFLAQILQYPGKLDFVRNDDDKLVVSIVYGLGHRNSLTQKFNDAGIKTRSVWLSGDYTGSLEGLHDLQPWLEMDENRILESSQNVLENWLAHTSKTV